MRKIQAGDVNAFRLLYERYKGPLLSFVAPFHRDPSQAEEVVQEVFLAVYRTRASWEPKARLSTWLWTIARNTSIDRRRKEGREVLDSPIEDQEGGSQPDWTEKLESPLPDAEAQLLEHAEKSRLENCVSKLPDKQREVLMLRTQSELPYEEIARVVGSSLQSVKSILFRARQALLGCLGHAGESK